MPPLHTDDEDTLPMYTPKINELPVVRHEHPLPELDPKNIAPDGVATPRTTTAPLPESWLRVLAALVLLLVTACGPEVIPSDPRWEQLVACYEFCDAAVDQCSGNEDCHDRCAVVRDNVTDECRSLAIDWYTCMADDTTKMNCSAHPPIADACEEILRGYYDCMYGGE